MCVRSLLCACILAKLVISESASLYAKDIVPAKHSGILSLDNPQQEAMRKKHTK